MIVLFKTVLTLFNLIHFIKLSSIIKYGYALIFR